MNVYIGTTKKVDPDVIHEYLDRSGRYNPHKSEQRRQEMQVAIGKKIHIGSPAGPVNYHRGGSYEASQAIINNVFKNTGF